MTLLLALVPQYNVTVEGITKSGKRTPGLNMLQFTTPIRVHLESAQPTSPTTGTATASTLPGNAFPLVTHNRRVAAPASREPLYLTLSPRLLLPSEPPAAFPPDAQYVFTLRKQGCPTCKPLTFTSPNVTASFVGLEPGATVRAGGGI